MQREGFSDQTIWAAERIGQPRQIGSFLWKVKVRKEFTVTTDAEVSLDSLVLGSFATCSCAVGKKSGRITYCAHVYRVWLEIGDLDQEVEDDDDEA